MTCGQAAVDVIVVTYRSADYIASCLDAALEAIADIPGATVIVVDNDSRDDIADVVATMPDRVRLVQRDLNDGFAHGCHVGAQASSARRLLLLNPDGIVRPDTVRALLDYAEEHPGAGIIGGRAVHDTGETDPRSWWGRPTVWSSLCFATGMSSVFPGSPIFDSESSLRWDGSDRAVPVVSGALMLVDRRLWDDLGGFDRDFFLYGEDADLCLRATAAGWSPRVCGRAVFSHRVGASSAGGNRLPMLLRGKVTTYAKNLPSPLGGLAAGLLVAGTGLRASMAGLRPPGRRPQMTAHHWRDAWQRRNEWRHGW